MVLIFWLTLVEGIDLGIDFLVNTGYGIDLFFLLTLVSGIDLLVTTG